jgi:hypothetical protein
MTVSSYEVEAHTLPVPIQTIVAAAQVACLNEDSDGSCRRVFKPWSERMEFSGDPLRSCAGDPELLLHIPFEGEVKVRAIAIIGGSPETAPATARLCAPTECCSTYTVPSVALLALFRCFENSCILACRYTNREDLDFGAVQDLQPVQQFDLNHDSRGILEYPVKCVTLPCYQRCLE